MAYTNAEELLNQFGFMTLLRKKRRAHLIQEVERYALQVAANENARCASIVLETTVRETKYKTLTAAIARAIGKIGVNRQEIQQKGKLL